MKKCLNMLLQKYNYKNKCNCIFVVYLQYNQEGMSRGRDGVLWSSMCYEWLTHYCRSQLGRYCGHFRRASSTFLSFLTYIYIVVLYKLTMFTLEFKTNHVYHTYKCYYYAHITYRFCILDARRLLSYKFQLHYFISQYFTRKVTN